MILRGSLVTFHTSLGTLAYYFIDSLLQPLEAGRGWQGGLREGNDVRQVTQPRAQGSIQLFMEKDFASSSSPASSKWRKIIMVIMHIIPWHMPSQRPLWLSIILPPDTFWLPASSLTTPAHLPLALHSFCSSHMGLVLSWTHLRAFLPQDFYTCSSLYLECVSPRSQLSVQLPYLIHLLRVAFPAVIPSPTLPFFIF